MNGYPAGDVISMDGQHKEKSSAEKVLPSPLARMVTILGILMVSFHMFTGYFGPYEPFVQRGIHLSFPIFLSFILYPLIKKDTRRTLLFFDTLLAE